MCQGLVAAAGTANPGFAAGVAMSSLVFVPGLPLLLKGIYTAAVQPCQDQAKRWPAMILDGCMSLSLSLSVLATCCNIAASACCPEQPHSKEQKHS